MGSRAFSGFSQDFLKKRLKFLVHSSFLAHCTTRIYAGLFSRCCCLLPFYIALPQMPNFFLHYVIFQKQSLNVYPGGLCKKGVGLNGFFSFFLQFTNLIDFLDNCTCCLKCVFIYPPSLEHHVIFPVLDIVGFLLS